MNPRFGSRINDSFWFIPLVVCAAGIILALVMVMLDEWLVQNSITVSLGTHSIEGGRGILIAIAGSVLGVAATSFSITTSVLATASSTYGPRLVRNFMADNRNQFVLGSFGASFLYSLIVLRSIRDASDIGSMFVPSISINLAILFGIFNVVMLIYFLHHIADSIQISTLVSRVRDDLIRSIDTLYARDQSHVPSAVRATDLSELPDTKPQLLHARQDGFIERIEYDELVKNAREHGAIIKMLVQPGDYVYLDTPVVEVWQDTAMGDKKEPWPTESIHIAQTRTPYQDIRYAVQQPVDITIRALSPGINDPYTAINAIHGLGSGLIRLVRHENPMSVMLDERFQPRVHRRTIEIEHILTSTFRTMRGNITRSLDATLATVELADTVLRAATHDSYRDIIVREIHGINEAYQSSAAPKVDKQIIASACEQVIDQDEVDRQK